MEEDAANMKALERQAADLKEAIDRLHEEERTTRNQIEQNKAGQRLKQLEEELKEQQARKKEAEANLALFTEWCTTLHLEDKTASDEESYRRIQKETAKAALRLDRENRLNEEDDFDAKNQHRKAHEEKDQLERELNILLHSKSNIPAHLVNVRRNCAMRSGLRHPTCLLRANWYR
ncbi:hypothetical protein LWM68_18630 [Niabella sp. W65]|nr:hypothetical protein [Niabella sp. W65]MCH7364591.1 hypothetical protein [Niabella sp. W65]